MAHEDSLSRLQAILAAVGKQTILYRSPDGSRILQLLHGGRVLGLFGASGSDNFYWTNPALNSEESARRFFAGDDWHNSGGDRTWLAPEVDFFFPKFPDLEMSTYWQPRGLDPGSYALQQDRRGHRMVNNLSLTLSRTKKEVHLEMAKWVNPALNPLRYEPDWRDDTTLQYAGYTQHTELRFIDGSTSEIAIGLWNLVQMPHGGDLHIPTYSRAEPKIYMGDVRNEDLLVSDRLVRYRMRAEGEHKIGLRAASMTGRVGYMYPVGEQLALIVRNFFVNPSGEYVDVPWRETDDFGYAVQACNVNSRLGAFSELEYHVPAIGGATGSNYREDISQIWAFCGPPAKIHQAAKLLLSYDSSTLE